MKKSLLTVLFLSVITTVFSQQQIRNKDYYLQKSRNQKNAGLITLGGGTALVIAGFLVGNSGSDDTELDNAMAGGIMVVTGAAAIVISIPLIIASGRNKRRAEKATVSFQMQPLDSPAISMYAKRPIPAVGIHIGL
jgi:hypothetical protein